MKLADKLEEKIAAGKGKDLPRGHFPERAEGIGIGLQRKAADADPAVQTVEPVSLKARAAILSHVPVEDATIAETSSVSDAAPANAARTGTLTGLVTEQVLAFKRIGTDSMDVAVRPDSGTEILLHLSMRNGQIEVLARVERGESRSLQMHWGDLQSSLALQGVRVGQLQAQTQLSNQSFAQHQPFFGSEAWAGGQSQPQSQGQSFRQSRVLDELPLVGSKTESPKTRLHNPTTAQRRGWESWA